MSKRVVVEFICDGCRETAKVEIGVPEGQLRAKQTLRYPKGWQTSSENTGIDICPQCVRKANDMCTQAAHRGK